MSALPICWAVMPPTKPSEPLAIPLMLPFLETIREVSSVRCHHIAAGEFERAQEFGDGGNFVAFVVPPALAEDEAIARCPSVDDDFWAPPASMARRSACRRWHPHPQLRNRQRPQRLTRQRQRCGGDKIAANFPPASLRKLPDRLFLAAVFKQIFTNNLPAKVASLVLATLLWAVIKKSQLSDPATMPKQPEPNVNFGAAAYGK